MTIQTQAAYTREEQWILDLFASSTGRSISRKVLLGLWESTFPKEGVAGLRNAIRNLQEKQIIKIAPDGALSLDDKN